MRNFNLLWHNDEDGDSDYGNDYDELSWNITEFTELEMQKYVF